MMYINVVLHTGQNYVAKWLTDTVDGMEVIRLDDGKYFRLFCYEIKSAMTY